jgi:ankyrin repeat protein
MRHIIVTVLALAAWGCDGLGQQAFGIFGSQEEVTDEQDATPEEELSDSEREQIEGTVQSLASQFEDALKSHLTERVQASRAASKLGQSKISPVSELMTAAANNQYEKAEKLLASGADPDHRSTMGVTALHSAAEHGYKDIVDLLLLYNATVDAPGPQQTTPLHVAAHRGRVSVTELLLRYGADVEARSANDAYTPLYLASEMGHTRIVARLLAANASVYARTSAGKTALHVAAEEGHEGVVAALIEAGAGVDETDEAGVRPVLMAAAAEHDDVVDLLLDAGAAPLTDDEREVHVEELRQQKATQVRVQVQTISMTASG